MGASTLTYTVTPITVFGNKRIHRVRFIVSSYGTDGISLTPAVAGMSIIDAIFGVVLRTEVANEPVQVVWDETNQLLICHKNSTPDDVDATTVFNLDVTVMGS